MFTNQSFTQLRKTTILGLVIGAIGIAILWAAGVAFPVYPPPGIIILGVGALIVGIVRRRWAPIIGASLGLFVLVGFLVSSTGISNLLGSAGAAVALGQTVQLIGVLLALVAGSIATRVGYRR